MENKNNLIFTTNKKVENSLEKHGMAQSNDEENLKFLNREYPNGSIVLLNGRHYLPLFLNGDREVFDISYMFENYTE